MHRERQASYLDPAVDLSRDMSVTAMEELLEAAWMIEPESVRELVNLPYVAEQVASYYEEMAMEKEVRILVEVASDALIIGNLDELRRALAQLVLNTVEVTPCGRRITISGEASRGVITLTVCNCRPRGVAGWIFSAWGFFLRPARRGLPHASWDGENFVENITEAHGGELKTIRNAGAELCVVIRLPVHG